MDFIKKYRMQCSIFTITACLLFNIFIRGLNPQDEGWVLYAAWRILQGDVPYKDFQYLYTPLSAFLGTLSFSIFGISILSERILALLLTSAVSVFLYNTLSLMKIPRNITIIALLFFVVWGPLQTNYLSPTFIAIELGIIYSYLILKALWKKQPKQNGVLFFLAGVTSSLILLSKQNFGFAVFLHVFILFLYLLKSRRYKQALFLILGMLGVFAVTLLYFFTTSSFHAFLNEMYSFLIIEGIKEHGPSYANVWTYPAPLLYKIGKFLFYSTPLLVSFGAIILSLKKRSVLFFTSLVSFLFYLVGFQPTMDTIHITPLIALSSLGIGSLCSLSESGLARKIVPGFVIIFLILGVYNGVYRNYYKWFAPIYTNTQLLTSPRAKILVHPSDASIFNTTTSYIENNTQKNEYIFNYGMTPLLYFLSARISPSRFNTIETRNVQGQHLEELLAVLKTSKPPLIISDGPFVGINPRIESFIFQNYTLDTTMSGRLIFKIKQM